MEGPFLIYTLSKKMTPIRTGKLKSMTAQQGNELDFLYSQEY